MPSVLNYFKIKNESSQKHTCVISNDSVSHSTKKTPCVHMVFSSVGFYNGTLRI